MNYNNAVESSMCLCKIKLLFEWIDWLQRDLIIYDFESVMCAHFHVS